MKTEKVSHLTKMEFGGNIISFAKEEVGKDFSRP